MFETKAGALIAVAEAEGADLLDTRAIVVPLHDDFQAMHFTMLDFFQWGNRARPMVREQLGWSLKLHVE